MTKYLEFFPKPLLDDLIAGRWLPVVGAGMSLNAKLTSPKKMPLWPELGELLSADLLNFKPASTLDAISAFQYEFGRAKLIEKLINVLHVKDSQPGQAHQSFCEMPFDAVCTTNFDFLLEREYEKGHSYVYTVVDEDQLSINGSPSGTMLLKLHGDLRHPGRLVVTEEDYDEFLSKYPLIATYLANLLITRTAIFVGYSLDDPDFRQIWQIVTNRLGKTRRMAYAIVVGASPSEIARYERRGVKVINLPGTKSSYGTILANTFSELHAHWRDNVISVSKVTEEEPLRELLLPRDARTRLCYFAVPLSRLSLYRSEVFPRVQSLGLVPITSDDVVSPGDNINAKIDALIDRAAIMVVEPTSPHTRYELRRALDRISNSKGQPHRMRLPTVIIDELELSHEMGVDHKNIYRLSLDSLTENPDIFVDALSNMLLTIVGHFDVKQDEEPLRLLRIGESRAAVISAMTLLETRLRESALPPQSQRSEIGAKNYPHEPLRVLLDKAHLVGIINTRERKIFDHWIRIRNDIVHGGSGIVSRQAREIIDGVINVVNKIPQISR